jgi:hypothetical protein
MVESQMNTGPEKVSKPRRKQPTRSQKGTCSGIPLLSRDSNSQQPVVPVPKIVPAPVNTRHTVNVPKSHRAAKPTKAVPQGQSTEQGIIRDGHSGQDEKRLADMENALLSKRLQETRQYFEDLIKTYRHKIDQLTGTISKIQKDAVADKATATKNHREVVCNLTKEKEIITRKNLSLEEQLKEERKRIVKINTQLELERCRRAKAESLADIDKGRAKQAEIVSERKSQLLKTLNAERDAGIKRVIEAQSERDRLQKQLKSEQEATCRLLNHLERERESRFKSEKEAVELRLQLTTRLALRNRSLDSVKHQELQWTVGCPVRVRQVVKGKAMEEGNINKLTTAMIQQLKTVRETFALHQPVKRIEYIMNDNLYTKFDETRSKLRSYGRSGQEQLLFHGTNQRNINA